VEPAEMALSAAWYLESILCIRWPAEHLL